MQQITKDDLTAIHIVTKGWNEILNHNIDAAFDKAAVVCVKDHFESDEKQTTERETVRSIIAKGTDHDHIKRELESQIPSIIVIYNAIIGEVQKSVGFDFYGVEDLYSFVSYLKFRVQQGGIEPIVFIEAILRSFGGLPQRQIDHVILPHVAKYVLNETELSSPWEQTIRKTMSPLHLMRKHISETKEHGWSLNSRHIMLIAQLQEMHMIPMLFDIHVLHLNETCVVFDSQFVDDK
eukprot:180560_1